MRRRDPSERRGRTSLEGWRRASGGGQIPGGRAPVLPGRRSHGRGMSAVRSSGRRTGRPAAAEAPSPLRRTGGRTAVPASPPPAAVLGHPPPAAEPLGRARRGSPPEVGPSAHPSSRHASASHPGHCDGRRTKPRTHPGAFVLSVVDVERRSGRFVEFFLPPFGEGRHGGFVLLRPEVRLLGGGEAHGTRPPFVKVLVVVELEVFSELPPSPLLLPTRRRVVRQVCVGVIVKEARHGLM